MYRIRLLDETLLKITQGDVALSPSAHPHLTGLKELRLADSARIFLFEKNSP